MSALAEVAAKPSHLDADAYLSMWPEVRMARACTVWERNGEDCAACGGPILAANYAGAAILWTCRDCGAIYKDGVKINRLA